MFNRLGLVFISLSMAILACNLSGNNPTKHSAPSLPISTVTGPANLSPVATFAEASTPDLANTVTYTNPTYGYTLNYPQGWYKLDGDTVTIMSNDPNAAPSGRNDGVGTNSKIDVFVVPVAANASLASVAQPYIQGATITQQTTITLASGEPAYWVELVDSFNTTAYLVVTRLDTQAVLAVGYGDVAQFTAIVMTIR